MFDASNGCLRYPSLMFHKNILSVTGMIFVRVQVERKTLTAVLMQRCDEDEAEGGWRVAGFGDTAEEDYLTAKADEAEEDRGSLVLFKFFKMELYQGGR